MKVKTFYIALILMVVTITVNSQPYNSPTIRNSSLNSTNSTLGSGLTRSTNYVHTKSVNYEWSGSAWVYLSSATYSYNADGKQTLLLLVDTVKSLNQFRQYNYYDVHKNQTGFIYQLWDTTGKKWDTVQGQRLLLQYNASNFITQKIIQEWNPQKSWVNSPKASREDYILDANGKYTQITVYDWIGNTWAPYYKDTMCTWNGDQLASFLEKIPISNGWKDDVKYSSVFPSGKNFIALYQTYNGSGWDSLYRFTRTYDTYGGYSHITEQYAGKWGNASRYLFYVDSLGNYYGYRSDEWYASAWVQYAGTLIQHTYNTNEVMLSEILSEFTTKTHKHELKEKHVFTEFKIPSTVSIKKLSTSNNIKIYPNPASDCIFINIKENNQTSSTMNLYDLNGRLILNRVIDKNENSIKVDLSGFKAGMYLMEVKNKNEVSRNRILIR